MVRSGCSGPGVSARSTGETSPAAEGASWSRSPTSTPKAADALAKAHGAEVRSADEIIAAKDIDAVADRHADRHPCRPHREGVRAGKAVFCEKPVDLDAKRIEKCLKVVEAAKGTLMIGFNRRFDPNFAALKERLDKRRGRQRSRW